MIPPHLRVFFFTKPIDMRASFDRLAQATRDALGEDIRSGALCCFINKQGSKCKLLWWDGSGLCIFYKRAHEARFVSPRVVDGVLHLRLDHDELARLIAGVHKHRSQRKILFDA